jgi:hypothetical protein
MVKRNNELDKKSRSMLLQQEEKRLNRFFEKGENEDHVPIGRPKDDSYDSEDEDSMDEDMKMAMKMSED